MYLQYRCKRCGEGILRPILDGRVKTLEDAKAFLETKIDAMRMPAEFIPHECLQAPGRGPGVGVAELIGICQ